MPKPKKLTKKQLEELASKYQILFKLYFFNKQKKKKKKKNVKDLKKFV